MSNEVRVMMEGNFYVVQASGSGSAWATASGATTALLGFVQSFSWTSAYDLITVRDRGRAHHHKVVGHPEIELTFSFQAAATANIPSAASGSGASVPMLHAEFKQSVPEDDSVTGHYYQFMGLPIQSMQFTENQEGNEISMTCRALAMNGVTGSGRIA
jgi:hypothetical protein